MYVIYCFALRRKKIIIAIKHLRKFWKIRVIELIFQTFPKCTLNGFPEGEGGEKEHADIIKDKTHAYY